MRNLSSSFARAIRLEAVAIRLEAVASRSEAVASRSEATTSRLETIASWSSFAPTKHARGQDISGCDAMEVKLANKSKTKRTKGSDFLSSLGT